MTTIYEQVEGASYDEIALKLATAFGDNLLGFDNAGNFIRLDVDALGGGGGGSSVVQAIEVVPISGGTCTLTNTPTGPVIGIASNTIGIREGTHFTVAGRDITVIQSGVPLSPLVTDQAVTWLYQIGSDPTQVQVSVPVAAGVCTLPSLPAGPVIGVHENGVTISKDVHFTVDAGAVVTISTYGSPATRYVPDGDVTWIYSTVASPTGTPAARTTIALGTADAVTVDSDIYDTIVIRSTNANDVFQVDGVKSVLVSNNHPTESKSFNPGSVVVDPLGFAHLVSVDGNWQEA